MMHAHHGCRRFELEQGECDAASRQRPRPAASRGRFHTSRAGAGRTAAAFPACVGETLASDNREGHLDAAGTGDRRRGRAPRLRIVTQRDEERRVILRKRTGPGVAVVPAVARLAALARLVALALLVAGPASASASTSLVPVLSGLDLPLFVTSARDGSQRLFVVEQGGVVRVVRPGAASATAFLDIRFRVRAGGERGLLGLAFHPQFSSNRRFFVNYTRQPDGATVIAEYRASPGDPGIADPAETVLLVIPQPFANHNGGMVEFGPDGFLYVAVGDGGSANDPGDRAQNVSDLLGSILRIDVDGADGIRPYAIPPDNPFAGATPGRDEIYAYGLRNPFRFSFDRATGDLYAADVGQNAVEEINIIVRGGNYGWRVWEGTRCTGLDEARCVPEGFIFPVAEYGHTGGRCAILGGHVYRGARASLPVGAYVYGDLCSGEILVLQNGVSTVLVDTAFSISSFGEDEAGELYVVDRRGGVYRIAGDCPADGVDGLPCLALGVSASVNQPAFATGEVLRLSAGIDNPGRPGAADFYLGVLMPDGGIAFLTSPGEITFGRADDLSSFHPIAVGVSLAAPFAAAGPDLVHQWTGGELRGHYVHFLLAVAAGALADGALGSHEILGLATAPFSFP